MNTNKQEKYDEITDFHKGFACVRQGDKWGYINPQGKTVQPFEYEAAEAFTHNMGSRERECVEAQKNGKRVAIDPQGKTLPENTLCMPLPPPLI